MTVSYTSENGQSHSTEESSRVSKLKPYKKMRLTVYGDLRRLTNGGTMCNSETGSGGVNTHF
jgi:hypothetical protein